MRILYIERFRHTARQFRAVLRAHSFTVYKTSPSDAERDIRERPDKYDIIFVDYEKAGDEVAALTLALKAEHPNLTFLFMVQGEAPPEGTHAATTILTHPIRPDTLLRTLDKFKIAHRG